MARNKKINKEQIYNVAIKLVDQKGLEQLTLQKIAQRLKVKPPSLYGHIKSFIGLKKHIATQANLLMKESIQQAIQNKSKEEAIISLAFAYRNFALKHKGLYQLSVIFPMKGSQAWMNSHIELRDLFADVLRKNYSLNEKDVRISARTLRSLLHGYLSFEINNGWSNIVDLEQSFQASIEHFVLCLETIDLTKNSKGFNAKISESSKNISRRSH